MASELWRCHQFNPGQQGRWALLQKFWTFPAAILCLRLSPSCTGRQLHSGMYLKSGRVVWGKNSSRLADVNEGETLQYSDSGTEGQVKPLAPLEAKLSYHPRQGLMLPEKKLCTKHSPVHPPNHTTSNALSRASFHAIYRTDQNAASHAPPKRPRQHMPMLNFKHPHMHQPKHPPKDPDLHPRHHRSQAPSQAPPHLFSTPITLPSTHKHLHKHSHMHLSSIPPSTSRAPPKYRPCTSMYPHKHALMHPHIFFPQAPTKGPSQAPSKKVALPLPFLS